MARASLTLLAALPLLFGQACGGGAGDPPPPCTKPGTLLRLAVQGGPAVGTAGSFGAFPLGMLMDCAPGGWSVFVASTTDILKPKALWVAQPNGTLLKVFHKGEVIPGAGGGTIVDFFAARVNAAGQILAEVTITGDAQSRPFCLLTAQVVGGVVATTSDLVYGAQDMTPTGVGGTLTQIDLTRIWFLDDGRTVFGGSTSSGAEAAWIVGVDGTGLDALVATGDTLPDGGSSVTAQDLRAFGVSGNGQRFAFVADVGGPFEDRLYIGTTGSATYAEVASDGNLLPGGGVVQEIHVGGPLLVYNVGTVMWVAEGNRVPPDDVVLAGSSTQPYVELARSGDLAPLASGGRFASIDLLEHRSQTRLPEVRCQLVGVPNGDDFGIYVVGSGAPLLSIYEHRQAPTDLGQATTFTDQLPGLSAPGTFDIASDDSFGFAALMTNGTSGMFWLVPDCGVFTLAYSGQLDPGGDTFGVFSPQCTHTCHSGVVLFRALLTTAGSGVFRQAP